VLLGGCSIKFAYNNADRFIRWQINDYLDLTSEQRRYLEREIDTTLAWHRKTHLPMYADYLEALPERFSDEVTPEMIQELFDQLFTWGAEVEAKAMPAMVYILQSLSDEQLADLPRRLEKDNVELAEDEVDGTLVENQDQWADSMRDMLSRFVGRLSEDQRTYIEIRSRGYTPERVMWAEYRRRWQVDLLRLLELRNEADFGARIEEHVNAREAYYGEYAMVSEANEELGREIAAYVFSSMSARQRDRFTETIEDLSQDFRELAARD
jgi:hypothetical protein